MFTSSRSAIVLSLFVTSTLLAAAPQPPLTDPFLNNFVGDWSIARKVGIEFRFDSKEGSLTNKFEFNPQTKSWMSLIRQEENGEWKTFAEEKWTKK